MNTLNIVFGVILLVFAVFLVIAVLMQSGKSKNLSGSIAGGAETFFGKTKGKALDKVLSKVTTIVAILFVVLVIVVYVIHDNGATDTATAGDPTAVTTVANDTTAADTTAADTTVAE